MTETEVRDWKCLLEERLSGGNLGGELVLWTQAHGPARPWAHIVEIATQVDGVSKVPYAHFRAVVDDGQRFSWRLVGFEMGQENPFQELRYHLDHVGEMPEAFRHVMTEFTHTVRDQLRYAADRARYNLRYTETRLEAFREGFPEAAW